MKIETKVSVEFASAREITDAIMDYIRCSRGDINCPDCIMKEMECSCYRVFEAAIRECPNIFNFHRK